MMRDFSRQGSQRSRKGLRSDRRSTVAVLFAILIIPILGCIGLAIDYGFWNQAKASIALAASDAALNAVKTAGSADLAQDPKYLTEGQQAGKNWFVANVGVLANAAHLTNVTPTVTMSQVNNIVTATVSYTGEVQSIFGHDLFGIGQYPLSVSASASINTAPYSEIQIMLDNSSSMQIAASPMDIADMLVISPCSPEGNWTDSQYTANKFNYYGFQYSGTGSDGVTYAYTLPGYPGWPPLTLPVTSGQPVKLIPSSDGANGGPRCTNVVGAQKESDGTWPQAGAPCAFACHSDGQPAGTGNDLYALARGTIGLGRAPCSQPGAVFGNCAVQLRFDVVKAAVNTVIQTMDGDNTAGNNLTVGVWDFNSQLTQDYPAGGGGEAGNDFAAAEKAVGGPPTYPNGPDSGIKPDSFVGGGTHSDTDFVDAATQLSLKLTQAGNGNTASSPLKFLFLVTDGVNNWPPNGNVNVAPFSTSACDLFKNMGYTIYVVYTPYDAVPHQSYFQYAAAFVQSDPSPVSTALQACASAPADYLVASDLTTLTAALQTFLKAALTSSANFTN